MRTTTTIASMAIAAGSLLTCSAAAWAGDDNKPLPPNMVAVGLYGVFYHTAANDFSGAFTPPGLNADVSDVVTAYFAYFRTLSAHFDMELAAGVPPTTDTIAKGPAKLGSVPWAGQTVGSVKWFSPTLLLRYKFCSPSARLRPYVGAGINFTHFYDRQINAAGDAALGGPTYAKLTNSIGPAATIGATYRVYGNWSANLSFSAAEVGSKFTTNTAGIVRTTKVEFNPQSIVFAVGYSF